MPWHGPGWRTVTIKLAGWGVVSRQDSSPRARAAAQKALELDNGLAGPLVTLANVKNNLEWDWAGAEQLCKRAIELDPNYEDAHRCYAVHLAEVGRVREAVAEARRATRRASQPHFHGNVIWKFVFIARQL